MYVLFWMTNECGYDDVLHVLEVGKKLTAEVRQASWDTEFEIDIKILAMGTQLAMTRLRRRIYRAHRYYGKRRESHD